MKIVISEQERTFLIMLLVFENQELRSDENKYHIKNLIKKLKYEKDNIKFSDNW